MPINESIIFPQGLDIFPVVQDYSGSGDSDAYILDASHHNKIRNFIGKVQPLIGGTSASSDGSITGIGYSYTFSVSFEALFTSVANHAKAFSRMPRSNVLPFQFVLTESTDVYNPPGQKNLLGIIQASAGQLNTILGQANDYSLYPLVTAEVHRLGVIGANNYVLNRFFINSNCILGSNTLLIQGVIIDTTLPTVNTSTSGVSNMPALWTNIADLEIVCSITGVI